MNMEIVFFGLVRHLAQFSLFFVFFFKQKTAYEIGVRLVGSEMCIRDRKKLIRDMEGSFYEEERNGFFISNIVV